MLPWKNSQITSLTGHLKRVQPQQPARCPDILTHGNGHFIQLHCQAGRFRNLRKSGGQSAAGHVTQAMHGNAGTNDGGHGLMQRSGITFQAVSERQPGAQAHNRHAVPPQIPAEQHGIPRTNGRRADLQPMAHNANPGSINVNAVPLSALHHFCIPRHNTDARRTGRGSHIPCHAGQDFQRKPFFQNKARRQIQRLRAAHGEIIHRSVHRQ